ncbi:MAG: DNA translocase FtsK, partial [Nostoc sp.]
MYKTTEVLRLQALYVADDEDPEYFQQLLLEAKNQNDPYTAWESGLDFDEFVASLYGESNSKDIGKSKATAVTKTKQHKTDFEGSFNFKVQLDEEARNSI